MAYAIVASKWLGYKRYIEAVLDSAADLAALGSGYAPDSRAIVAEGGAAYMTDASGHWQELGSPGGGGGSSVTVEPLTVTQNGTTTAPSGKAYSPVTTNVPNSYSASDEGKVVSNGALVTQTAHAAVTPTTSDQTVDTTTNSSCTVKGDANLVAGNIKDGVPLFGVTGSYSGGGGNPNTVETISNVNVASIPAAKIVEIVAGLADNSLTAYVSTSNVAFTLMPAFAFASLDKSGYLMFTSCATNGTYSAIDEFFMLGYDDSGNYDGFSYKTESGNVVGGQGYTTNITTTLTIIHHPLPDSE